MTETSLPIAEKKSADRLWWLPFPLALLSAWWINLPIDIHDLIYPQPRNGDSGYIGGHLCWLVLFMTGIPGILLLFSVVTMPAIRTLWKKLNIKNDPLLLLTKAYLCATIIGIIGTVRVISYKMLDRFSVGETHFAIDSPHSTTAVILYTVAAIAPGIAILALLIGWLKRKILLSTFLVAILSPLLIIVFAHFVLALGGTGNTCDIAEMITPP